MPTMKMALLPEFRGEPVVLVAADKEAYAILRDALKEALLSTEQEANALIGGTPHTIHVCRCNARTIVISAAKVEWHFNSAGLQSLIDMMNSIVTSKVPCHQYLDISGPAQTLVLSYGEYSPHALMKAMSSNIK